MTRLFSSRKRRPLGALWLGFEITDKMLHSPKKDIDVSFISDMKKLKYLNIDGFSIPSIDFANNLPLENLNINFTKVTTLEPLRGTKQSHLAIMGLKLPELSPLSDAPFASLAAWRAEVGNLEHLRKMKSLTLLLAPKKMDIRCMPTSIEGLDLAFSEVVNIEWTAYFIHRFHRLC
jgi:hypothetical protein